MSNSYKNDKNWILDPSIHHIDESDDRELNPDIKSMSLEELEDELSKIREMRSKH